MPLSSYSLYGNWCTWEHPFTPLIVRGYDQVHQFCACLYSTVFLNELILFFTLHYCTFFGRYLFF